MSLPAGQRPVTQAAPAGTTNSGSTEELVRATHGVLDHYGVGISPSKVSRLVRTYQRTVAGNGVEFGDWIANNVLLLAAQRHLVADELRRVISYADPTGETAVRNVLAGGRRE